MNDIIVNSLIQLFFCAVSTMVFVQVFKTLLNGIANGKLDPKTLVADGDFPSSHTAILISFNIVFWYLMYSYTINNPTYDMYGPVLCGAFFVLLSCYIIRDAMGIRLRVQEHAQIIAELATYTSNSFAKLVHVEYDVNTQTLQQELNDLLKNHKLKAGHLPHEVLGGIFVGGFIGIMFVSVISKNFTVLVVTATTFVSYIIITILVFIGNKKKKKNVKH